MPAPTLTAAQLTRLRQRPHRTRVWLSVYQPGTVLSARINHPSIPKGTREITITILAGDFNSVERGQTVYIGTTPGGQDLGRIRAIDCSASVLTLAENATDWISGWYLTVVTYYEPWAVFPRILLDANNVPSFYKDFDIAYSDQNQYLDPLVCMGPNHAGFLAQTSTGSYASVYYSRSGTFDPDDGGIPTGAHRWVFEGGTPSGSLLPDPGYINYTGAGHFLTSLTVTGDNGKQFTGRRHVSIYTRPDEGPRPPILRWSLQSFEGSRDSAGYAVRLAVHETADFSKVVDGALVVLFSDSWEGGVAGKKSAGAENRDSILFVGYIEDDSIRLNPTDRFLEFNVRSITGIAERLATYSAALESKVSAMTWNELRNLTVDKGVIHFLRWHSTLLSITDFAPTGDTLNVQFLDFARGNLRDAVESLYNSALLASMVADRQGKMWSEIDLSLTPTGSSRLAAAGAGFDLTRQDWRGEIAFTRYGAYQPISYIELGGIGYSGPATGTFGAYLAGAPGDVAGYFGSVERAQGLVLAGQDQLNRLVGLSYARANARFPELSMEPAGDYRILDIAPQQRVLVSLAADENYRGLVWDDKPFVLQALGYDYRESEQALLATARLREETDGPPASTILIPVEPPYDKWALPDWNMQFPPILPFPGLFPPIEPPPTNGDLVYGIFNNLLVRTRNFFSGLPSPTWELVNPSGTFGVGGSVAHFYLDYAAPHQIAYEWDQLTNAGDGQAGPRGRYTNNLDAAVPTWTQFWGLAETQAYLEPGGGSRQMSYADQIPELAYQILWGGNHGGVTRSWFLVGAPFSWSRSADILGIDDSYDDGSHAAVHRGGGIFGIFNLNTLRYNAAGGLGSWGASPGIGILINRAPIAFAGGVLWASDEFGPPGTPEMLFDPLGWVPTVTPGRLNRCSPVFDGALWATLPTTSGWHAGGNIKVINGIVHAFMAPSTGGTRTVLLKSSDMASWQIIYDSPNNLGPLEYLKTNTLKMCTYERFGVASSRVLGSQDGGYTWYDKTGNLGTLVGLLGTGSLRGGLKFAWTF